MAYYNDKGGFKEYGFLSADFHVKIDGLGDVERFVEGLGIVLEQLEHDPLSIEQLEKIGQNAVKYAKELLELNQSVVSWNLWNSVSSEVTSNNKVIIYADAKNRRGVPYGTFVEYGYRHRTKTGYEFVAPRPFLRPALEFAKLNTQMNLENSVKELIHYAVLGRSGALKNLHWVQNQWKGYEHRGGNRGANPNRNMGRPTKQALKQAQQRGNFGRLSTAQKNRFGRHKTTWSPDQGERYTEQARYGLYRNLDHPSSTREYRYVR